MKDKVGLAACIRPEYAGRFKCDGQACGAECCRKWIITIDEDTYQKYRKVKLKNLRAKLKQYLVTKEYEGILQHFIKLDHKGSCPFLQPDNFCKIQRACGEEYLSKICRTYPRLLTQLTEDLVEETLTLSCPVAARCCLLNREPLRFEQIERDLSRMSVSCFSAGKLLQPALLSMQGPALGILQRYTEERPDLRFALLGFFLDRADELAQSDRAGEIENCGQLYLSGELDGEVEQTLRLCTEDATAYIRYMLTVLELFYGEENRHPEHMSVQPYLDSVMNAYGIQSETVVLSDVVERYVRIRGVYCDKIYEEYGYIWTNYFLNHYFSMLYPYGVHEKVTVAYEFFVTVCKLAEFFALAFVDKHKGETCEDDMIELLRYVDNKVIHSHNDRMNLLQMIKDEEHGFLDVMRLLLDGGCR